MQSESQDNKIVVEVPNSGGNYNQLPQAIPSNRMTEFRRGIENAIAVPALAKLIAFPESLGDVIYDCLSQITISSLLMSLWLQPLPAFIRFAVLLLLIVAAVGTWYLLGIPEARGILTFRVFLIGVGAVLPLLP